MSPGVAARKRFGGVGFALGCGCRDPKAVAVAASASSPWSAAEASTATSTTATSRRGRSTHPSASASTGTLTVPSASSSSFLWEDADAEADGDGDGDEVECKRASSAATTPSFSGLLRQLGELEQGVKSFGRKSSSSPRRNHFSQPPPPPPPPPPLPLGPVLPQRRALRSVEDKPDGREGHGNFSPPPLQVQTQQHRRAKSVDKVNRQEGDAQLTPLPRPPRPLPPPPPEEELRNVKAADRVNDKGDGKQRPPTPQLVPRQRRAKSFDSSSNSGGGGGLDESVAVVKKSEDPLSDFRRSMLNMIVENGIVTGDELRELLRRFLALNAPRHHDAILRAFAEIWDEVFAAGATAEPAARPKVAPTRQRTPPRRRRHPLPAWRV